MPGNSPGNSQASLSSEETTALVDQVQTWRYSVDARQLGFFLAKKHRTDRHRSSESLDSVEDQNDRRPTTPGTPGPNIGFTWLVGSLATYEHGFFDGVDHEDRFVCFADPSTYLAYPGWMLRNLLILVQHRWKLDRVQILCYRDVQARRHEAKSVILDLQLDRTSEVNSLQSERNLHLGDEVPKITGWERNAAGKLASKIASLGEYMNPQR